MKYLIGITLAFFQFISCSHVFLRADTEWHILIRNARGYPVKVVSKYEATYGSGEPDYSRNPLYMGANADSSLTIGLTFYETDQEPEISDSTDYLFCLFVDSGNVLVDSILINRFPFPEYDHYKFCSEYYEGKESYCSPVYLDTLTISDSVISTIPLTRLFRTHGSQ
jgi:hypothetical protein